jgi:anti-anti-sigma regulatory factor
MAGTRLTTGRVEAEIDAAAGGGEARLALAGQIDEGAELDALLAELRAPRVVIDLARVSFINSVGVREWIRLLATLRERKAQVTLSRCSEVMVAQMNMIVECARGAAIESFHVPYLCGGCGHEAAVCLEVAAHRDQLARRQVPAQPCPSCGGAMQIDELPERYLLFLAPEEARS